MATALLSLVLDRVAIRLRLEHDPRHERRALAHGGGHALTHAGPLAPGAARELVIALGRRFAAAAPTAGSLDHAIATLAALVDELAPTAHLERTLTAAHALPRWPSSLRTGAPRTGALWPFDAELIGLARGLRRIVKRECFDDAAERADRAWLEAHGVTVARVGPTDPDGRRVLLGALDPRALDDGIGGAEHALRQRDEPGAARALGAQLGYPRCCVDAFVGAAGRDDLALLAALLPPPAAPPAPPWTQWLNAPVALISHAPCALTCAPTIALARALLDGLEAAYPGFAGRWLDLAARVHVIDSRGRGLALRGRGDLATGFAIDDAIAFAVPARADLADVAAPVPEAVGRIVRVDPAAALDGPELIAMVGADHTGPT
jgi:hypothetical protein